MEVAMTSHPFDKHYFHGGGKVGGYAGSGYRDFPVHWTTYAHVMQRDPQSVLELGCARGYLLKRFAEYAQIPVLGLEISRHCYLTRAIDRVVTHDVTKPWPVVDSGDKPYDLCLSVAFLEHVPEADLPLVFAEMERTCKRGLHGIDIHDHDHFDQTHVTMRDLSWWQERLPPGHEAVDKEELESGTGTLWLPPGINDGVKLNLGSFTTMFHGWRNIDVIDLTVWARREGYQFTCCDITNGLPYDDGVVGLIFLSHVLEHFDYDVGARLLRECQRVLRPGGKIRIAVPDADHLFDLYRAREIESLREIAGVDSGGPPIRMLHELLYGDDHRAIYDQSSLMTAIANAGFTTAYGSLFGQSESPTMRRETIDLYPELSLYVEAVR